MRALFLVLCASFAWAQAWQADVEALAGADPDARDEAARALLELAAEDRPAARAAIAEAGPEALARLDELEAMWQARDAQQGLWLELEWPGVENYGSFRPALRVTNVGAETALFALPIAGSSHGLRTPRVAVSIERPGADGWEAFPQPPPPACGMLFPRTESDFVRLAPFASVTVESFLPWVAVPAGAFRVWLRYAHVAEGPDPLAEEASLQLLPRSVSIEVEVGPLLVEP